MQTSTITFLPLPLPNAEGIPHGTTGAGGDGTYLAAAYHSNLLEFEHKLTLTNGGQTVQVMTKDATGFFTVALPGNAFTIANEFLGIEMLAPVSGQTGIEYSIRLFKNSSTQGATVVPGTVSQVVLKNAGGNNPQIILAEMSNLISPSTGKELNFIGTTDVRTGFTAARVIIRPSELVYLKANSNGDITFQF